MNSDIGHLENTVYYDSELKALDRAFKDCYEIFKQIRKRSERRETVQISKSLFDYVERKKFINSDPSLFFDLHFDDYRCCIYYWRKKYRILCLGFESPDFNMSLPEWKSTGNLYGSWSSLCDELYYFYLRSCLYLLNNVISPKLHDYELLFKSL